MYTGKNQMVKVDLDNLLNSKVSDIESIRYDVAKKNPEFISAVEVAVEDCTGNETDIHDEVSYKLAIASLIMLIENEEKSVMENNVAVNETTVESTNNHKEEKVMMGTVKENMSAAVEEMMGKFADAKENIKVNAGETKDEYFNKVDDSLNVMKGALGNVLDTLDRVLGFTVLKHSILDIIEAGTQGKTSGKSLFKMAKRCRELIEEEIENLELWGSEESLKGAVQLKALTEGVRGKSIFEAFVSGCIWIGKKVTRKLRKWFNVDSEKSVIGSICRSIAGFTNILRAGVKLVWNTAKFAVSFVVSGIIKVADFVFRAIKTLVTKIKDFAIDKYNKLVNKDIEDDFEDDDFADEELAKELKEFEEE